MVSPAGRELLGNNKVVLSSPLKSGLTVTAGPETCVIIISLKETLLKKSSKPILKLMFWAAEAPSLVIITVFI